MCGPSGWPPCRAAYRSQLCMTGSVDKDGRALIAIRLRHPDSGAETPFGAWIDTGFTGELVLPQPLIAPLGLPVCQLVRAVLAGRLPGASRELQLLVGLVRRMEVGRGGGESRPIPAARGRLTVGSPPGYRLQRRDV